MEEISKQQDNHVYIPRLGEYNMFFYDDIVQWTWEYGGIPYFLINTNVFTTLSLINTLTEQIDEYVTIKASDENQADWLWRQILGCMEDIEEQMNYIKTLWNEETKDAFSVKFDITLRELMNNYGRAFEKTWMMQSQEKRAELGVHRDRLCQFYSKIGIEDQEQLVRRVNEYVLHEARKMVARERKELENEMGGWSDGIGRDLWAKKLDEEMIMLRDKSEEFGREVGIWFGSGLFDINVLGNEQCHILNMLDLGNIDLFARLVLRGNIIRSEMNENVKREFEAWLRGKEYSCEEENSEVSVVTVKEPENDMTMSEEEIWIWERIEKYVKELNRKARIKKTELKWKAPATEENVLKWLEKLYGVNESLIDKEDKEYVRKFRGLFKKRKAQSKQNMTEDEKRERHLEIGMCNIVGYLMGFGYLKNAQKELGDIFFGSGQDRIINNINHGCTIDKNGNTKQDEELNRSFKDVIPFMDRHRKSVIEGGKRG